MILVIVGDVVNGLLAMGYIRAQVVVAVPPKIRKSATA